MGPLNYHHLRYFWAVAHEGNLTRAAERLFVSQSAVSVQIQKLETDLGHSLFERKGRRLVLTEVGSMVLDHADAIFQLGDELLGTLGARGGKIRHVLRVGAVSTLSRNFQLSFLGPLLGRSDAELIIRSGALPELLDELEAHRIDVLLATVAPVRDARSGWVPHLIAKQPVSLIGAPERAVATDDIAQLLTDYEVLVPTLDSSIRTGFDALASRLGVRPTIAAEVDDMAMLRLLARDGRGLAVVPPIVVKDELASGRLVEASRLPGLEESFFALAPSRRFPHPLLTELLGQQPPRNAE